MLNRKDFFAIFVGQIVVTLSLMTLAAKSQCTGECESLFAVIASTPTQLADVN